MKIGQILANKPCFTPANPSSISDKAESVFQTYPTKIHISKPPRGSPKLLKILSNVPMRDVLNATIMETTRMPSPTPQAAFFLGTSYSSITNATGTSKSEIVEVKAAILNNKKNTTPRINPTAPPIVWKSAEVFEILNWLKMRVGHPQKYQCLLLVLHTLQE